MAIEIVDFPIKNGDFPVRYVKLPEGNVHCDFPLVSAICADMSWKSWIAKPFFV